MGFRPTAEELAELIDEIDEDGSGAIEFGEFAQLCAKFLVEDPDPETMRAELKTAFRLFDKAGTVSGDLNILSALFLSKETFMFGLTPITLSSL